MHQSIDFSPRRNSPFRGHGTSVLGGPNGASHGAARGVVEPLGLVGHRGVRARWGGNWGEFTMKHCDLPRKNDDLSRFKQERW